MEEQHTLRQKVEYTGRGLHTGQPARLRLLPASPGEGITFYRMDLAGRPSIPARPEAVLSTMRCTTLGWEESTTVRTVEHLLAALAGLGVDNVRVELWGPEIPAGDGSAQAFVDLLDQAGLQGQGVARRVRRLLQPVWASNGSAYIVALPAPVLKISFLFTNPNPAVGNLYAEYTPVPEVFRRELAPARTVAFLEELEALRRQGLANGGSEDMAVVVGPGGYVNARRFPDEIVRHKILDVMGDLALVGPLAAHIIALRSGHTLDVELARKIAAAGTGVDDSPAIG
ncbi:MAG: UDP-3-O-[3-hydroxymyristoyl] N-acetylglucosamine deacetylase [Firmicutes bacterium]|nr:UDP-3-O-[3-hydroxymyristoyl] N-acetylglucosamine deacetylase [Bacillota bacterium]